MKLPSDAELALLVGRAQAHDPDAFHHLYASFVDLVYRYCVWRGGTVEVAQAIVGRMCGQLVAAMPTVRLPQHAQALHFGGYLLRMADAHLDERQQQPAPRTGEGNEPTLQHAHVLRPSGRWHDDVWAALNGLPPKQQTIIILRYMEGFSATQVAIMVGTSRATVTALNRHALGVLASRRPSGGTPRNEG